MLSEEVFNREMTDASKKKTEVQPSILSVIHYHSIGELCKRPFLRSQTRSCRTKV